MKEVEHRYFGWKWFVGFVVLVLLVVGVWMLFFSYAECDSWECFNEYLRECKRVRFIGGTDMIFEYAVRGSSDGHCEVNAMLLQGELSNQDSVRLEGQEMTCFLPKGVVMIPESDIGRCHGLLKEGLQDLVIEKLHAYLVQNLGQINLEMIDVSE
jgi:hypothetical protein